MYFDQHIHYKQVMLRYQRPANEQAEDEFINKITLAFSESPDAAAFDHFSIETVLDYIRRTHAFYLGTKLPEIGQTIYSLSTGTDTNKELTLLLEAAFTTYYRGLEAHIKEEETFLLPYITQLYIGLQDNAGLVSPMFLHDNYSLETFEQTHTDTEGDLTLMRSLIQRYQPSAITVSPYRILISQLENFEADLNVHAFIEDEVLIPKAKIMESQLLRILAERNGRM
ncbi:hemerythrin domain-containing protein [Deminuibacter soli]|uniref:Hemerythrin-like domain-containing protein n=1 Tax=Deminuibacter soli TaxID=2291815 RepID=A0A3E1NG10_9BACT|nr:hemerythrin domain-containing protein [Deminuibacter soli]RFM26900.1 hypothetical protein DXN05_18110 [Deminuibacter soli]